MNDENLLSNPTPFDFPEREPEDEKDENLYSKDQLTMGIDKPSEKIQRIVSSSRMNLKKRNEILEISMLWKTPALPFAITTLILDLLVLIGGGIVLFNTIPPKIPLFYNSVDRKWEQTDKSIIFIFPVVLFIVEAVIINFLIKIFRYDRRLSLVSFWILTLLNVLIFIIISQFFTLLI